MEGKDARRSSKKESGEEGALLSQGAPAESWLQSDQERARGREGDFQGGSPWVEGSAPVCLSADSTPGGQGVLSRVDLGRAPSLSRDWDRPLPLTPRPCASFLVPPPGDRQGGGAIGSLPLGPAWELTWA